MARSILVKYEINGLITKVRWMINALNYPCVWHVDNGPLEKGHQKHGSTMDSGIPFPPFSKVMTVSGRSNG
jgi:hypothetical protein